MSKPYDPTTRCIKCGNQGANSKWVEGQAYDWIIRTCRRCGYDWNESCLDKKNA